jgi:hypothetical protein
MTFKPNINPVSKMFGRKTNDRPEDYLIKKGKMVQEKLDKKRSELIYDEQSKCSFHPQVNKKSEQMIMEKSKVYNEDVDEPRNPNLGDSARMNSNKFLDLFEDALRRKER